MIMRLETCNVVCIYCAVVLGLLQFYRRGARIAIGLLWNTIKLFDDGANPDLLYPFQLDNGTYGGNNPSGDVYWNSHRLNSS